ncbi:MAG: hypothetical protein ACREBQ_08135 [Nitrososphaerales archaeon]
MSEPKSTYMIVLINGTSYCAAPQTTWIGQCSAEIGDSSQLYIYQSSINLSDPCTAFQEIGQTNASLSTPYSNVENSPKFIALEGNRTEYAFGGGDCGASTGTTAGSQLNLNFYYGDSMHPFKVCGNSTAIPTYQIDVGIDLTPTGYDLYHSVYSSLYFGPTNTTATCITPYTTTQYTLRSGETPLLASKDSLHASPALECAIEPHGLSTPWFALSSTFYRPVLNPR